MFKIYTSYFSNPKLKNKHNDMMFIPVCSRIYTWDGYSTWYRNLAPSDKILNYYNNVNTKTKAIKEWFTQRYLKELELLKESGDLDRIVSDMNNRLQYEDLVLLCYEKSNQFCHRHVLRQFLNEQYDLHIEEY